MGSETRRTGQLGQLSYINMEYQHYNIKITNQQKQGLSTLQYHNIMFAIQNSL